ncbi:MAG: peptidoglycan domain protein [Muribaculaceae bacterium]|nr:peptidoglycan domain protein [Muribaculaceae bacterium]
MHKLIPFILHFEAGLPASKLSLPWPRIFEEARKSGFSNDPHDAGGATLCGVTIATLSHYRHLRGLPAPTVAELKALPADTWRDILKSLFWDRWQADRIASPEVARILVDWVWASGVHGIRIPQRMLGVKTDGVVGPATLAALNRRIATEGEVFANILTEERLRFIDRIIARRPSQAHYRAGWRRRIQSIRGLPITRTK